MKGGIGLFQKGKGFGVRGIDDVIIDAGIFVVFGRAELMALEIKVAKLRAIVRWFCPATKISLAMPSSSS